MEAREQQVIRDLENQSNQEAEEVKFRLEEVAECQTKIKMYQTDMERSIDKGGEIDMLEGAKERSKKVKEINEDPSIQRLVLLNVASIA